MAEISVAWLLFLGVFMVVVSSGVLAASQWQNFSSVGQYAILFGYTLAFWFASWWTRQRPNLNLTCRILQVTTLLLIPVNLWAIDGFHLWRSGLGLVVGAIASLSLSAIAWTLLQSALPMRSQALVLSWLQLGWTLPGFPLIAIYSGTVGTAAVLWHWVEKRRENLADLGMGGVAIALSTLLLMGRGVLGAGVPIDAIGLALGICGWVLCWLTRRQVQIPFTRTGIGLLGLGWIVSVGAEPPWQAIAVSILGIWLLANRLQRLWQVWDLLALFFVGLQAYSLLWRLIPPTERQQILAFATQIAGGNLIPGELIGLALFPYLTIALVAASRLRRASQLNLASYTEGMALILGIVLALVSLFHPLVRSLYLLASTLTLIAVLRQRSTAATWLIYLAHVTGILTVGAWIGWGFPNLNARFWAIILLIGMVAEWGFCSRDVQMHVSTDSIWRRSAWHIGLVLAGLSYPLLIQVNPSWGLIWLITPASLTFLANRPIPQARLASWLSIITLLLVPGLTEFSVTPLLVSTAVATSLMLVNTQQLRSPLAAAITVGFGLSFFVTCLWQIWGEISLNWLPIWIGSALGGLWLFRRFILREIYQSALDGWAIALSTINLIFLSLGRLEVYSIQDLSIVLAAVITTGAITYRTWQQPTNLGFYGIAWGTELLVSSLVWWTVPSFIDIAIANLGLGLATQFVSDWWVRRSASSYFSSWHVIPLIYATLGLIFAHHTFTAHTGIYTLAAVFTGIGVGRRFSQLKLVIYISVAGISFAAYELLTYQLMQSKGGQAGDGIVLLSALATAIAIIYHFFSRWLLPYWRLAPQELLFITHLHWGGGSLFCLLALGITLSNFGSNLWLGVTVILAAYAVWQGRNRNFWVYLAVVQLTIAIAHCLNRILALSALLNWASAIACIFAYLFYSLPWQTWGWSKQPWQRSATILPGLIVLLTVGGSIQSLFLVAAFYAWLARVENTIRLSYLSIGLADWAIIRILPDWNLNSPLWYVSVLSGSLLYLAQVEPTLRSPSEKEKRHILRTLAVGLFCLTALYQSDNSWWQGIFTIFLSIGLILAGIGLRTRAYLYVGTLTFIFKVLRQLWLFIDNYSLLLWAIGIVVGLLFIWIAATFEARRAQAIALVQTWIRELEAWE
jgi:hypothetical protein